jgi:hypothetical protein
MGKGEQKAWSADPSDLNPFLFYNWRCLTKVYCICYRTQWFPGLATTNREYIGMFHMTNVIFLKIGQLIFRCATSCFEVEGEQFEHFLQTSIDSKLKPCFRMPVII